MAESSVADASTGLPLAVRQAPLFVGVVAAVAALVAAAVDGYPLPLDVAGVFLVIGLATTWIARQTPLRGAFCVGLLAFVVLATVYGG